MFVRTLVLIVSMFVLSGGARAYDPMDPRFLTPLCASVVKERHYPCMSNGKRIHSPADDPDLIRRWNQCPNGKEKRVYLVRGKNIGDRIGSRFGCAEEDPDSLAYKAPVPEPEPAPRSDPMFSSTSSPRPKPEPERKPAPAPPKEEEREGLWAALTLDRVLCSLGGMGLGVLLILGAHKFKTQ